MGVIKWGRNWKWRIMGVVDKQSTKFKYTEDRVARCRIQSGDTCEGGRRWMRRRSSPTTVAGGPQLASASSDSPHVNWNCDRDCTEISVEWYLKMP